MSRSRLEVSVVKSVSKSLNVSKRHGTERLLDEPKELLDIGSIGSLRMRAAPMNPQLGQLLISVGLTRSHRCNAVSTCGDDFSLRFVRMQDNRDYPA